MKHQYEANRIAKLIPGNVLSIFKEEDCIIAGGAITSIFCNREVNDIDVYFRSQESLLRVLQLLYEEESFSLICTNCTDKSILFTDGKEDGLKVQFIYFRYFDGPQDLFGSFDFTVNMGAYLCKEGRIVLHPDFLVYNSQRYLKYNPDTDFPLLSVMRVDKYRERGYTISKTEMMRVAISASRLSLTSWDEAKEHIGGVYGYDMDNLFNEDKEFSVDELLEQLSNITSSDMIHRGSKKHGLLKLKHVVTGHAPRFFKYVKKSEEGILKSLFSSSMSALTYKVGETVNGGDGGVFCSTADMDPLHGSYSGQNRVLVELEPLDKNNFDLSSGEVRIYGDVLVKRIVPEDEDITKES